MKTWIKENKIQILTVAVPILYFLCMLKYYLVDYYVPDFRLYASFAQGNLSARDGFSSLFIWLAGWASIAPKLLTIFCLVLLSLSIFNFLVFYREMFGDRFSNFILAAVILVSCGIWYYFYGKIFYDFPFSIFTYTLSMLLYCKFNKTKDKKYWFIFCFLLGLTLSWKPYNIFLCAGLGLLLLCKDETRSLMLLFLVNVKKLAASIGSAALGYVIGNYNILFHFKETVKGILAYPASFNIKDFFIFKSRLIWDHVNDLPFNIAIMSIVTAMIILFLLPILVKKYKYLFVSIFMAFCFCYFVKNCSPGYAWHGLTFGGFIITFAFFVVSEITNWNSILKATCGFAIVVQFVTNFAIYIPMQNRWHDETQKSIAIEEDCQYDIYEDVMTLAQKIEGTTFCVDNAIKRYKPISTGNTRFDLKNRGYVVLQNKFFADPLRASDWWSWGKVAQVNCGMWEHNLDYLIFIVPNPIKLLGDVADVNLYAGKEKVESICRDEYEVVLYKMR